jgi:hypothetical protein
MVRPRFFIGFLSIPHSIELKRLFLWGIVTDKNIDWSEWQLIVFCLGQVSLNMNGLIL